MRLAAIARIVFDKVHLRRTALVAALVGTWLTAINHGDTILEGHWQVWLILKICLNYLTPFVVANLGLISRQVASSSQDI